MVFHEGIPVAFAGIQPSKQWCDTAYLSRCGVLPKYRGKGLQKRLLSVREKYARAQNLNWLITNTYKNIPSANALIRKGFKMYEPANPWGCRGTLYWLKKVSS